MQQNVNTSILDLRLAAPIPSTQHDGGLCAGTRVNCSR